MRRITFYLFIAFVSLLFVTCESDYVDPIDIFETEELENPHEVNVGSAVGVDTLYVNADRIIETEEGYHIKGTLFSKSLSGTIPITNGDFTIETDPTTTSTSSLKSGFAINSSSFDFYGYGTADFPRYGFLEDTEIEDIPGGDVYYNTGAIFKLESNIDQLPLNDERYYFRYKIDNPNKYKEYKVKNTIFKLREFYMDAHDPATLFVGDIYRKTKDGLTTKLAEQVGIGLSVHELWQFEPYEYSERLEEAVEGTGFEPINGGIYLAGIVPMKKYPVKVLGEAVINTSFSSLGTLDFFDRGFDDASFQLGMNGKLFFSNQLVGFLSGSDTIELGKATMQVEYTDDESSIRMAGEYTQDYLKRFIGDDRLENIAFNEKHGMMYLRCTDNLDDFIVYLEENIQLAVPGLGNQELAKTVFKITKDEVELSGIMELPYGIGAVEVLGKINMDGSFLLKGTANSSLDLGNGIAYDAEFDIEISNNGVALSGMLDMPYDIGEVHVEGQINTDGTILLRGSINSSINLGEGLSYEAALEMEISNSGVSLYGKMTLPYNIGDVELAGGITADEIYFSGTANASVGFPTDVYIESSLQIQISSASGILLQGSVDLPAGIGSASVLGEISSSGLLLTGQIGSGIDVNLGNVSIKTNAAMSLTMSSNSGVIFTGEVSLPFSLGYANISASVLAGNGISLSGAMGSQINIAGYPAFSADMSVSASTSTGLRLYGEMKFPGGLGWIYVSGYVTSSSYRLTGGLNGVDIDFGVVSLGTDFNVTISNSGGVEFSAEGEGCVNLLVEEVCASVGVGMDINYNTGSVKLCIDFPVPGGDVCIGF